MKKENNSYPYYEQKLFNNMKEILEYRVNSTPDDIAYLYREAGEIVSKTYKDLYYDVLYLSNYLYKKFKNKKIGVMGENSYNWIVFFLAIMLSGNVAVAIDKDADPELLKYLLKQSDSKYLFYSRKYCRQVDSVKIDKDALESMNELIELDKSIENKYDINSDDCACIFFTSGTTGPNKAVMLSHKNIAANIYGATSIYWESGPTVDVLPYHHTFGLLTAGFMPIYNGFPVFINSSLKYVLKDLQEGKPETLIVVPLFVETFYKQIWKTARNENKDKKLKRGIKISNALRKLGIDRRRKMFKDVLDTFGGALDFIICGGAYLDEKYIDFFDSIGITIVNGYGITECSPVVSVNRNNQRKYGSVGQLCRGVEVDIIDEEICIKGPSVMLGYYNDKKATKSVLIDGYFHTGDLGYIDKDNFLFITGRKKNLIILSNGENISPETIESYILNDKATCECVVYARDGKIIACIYPNEEYLGDQEYFDELIHKYNLDKPKNKQVSLVELRNTEMPKNSNKKILRNKVIEGE